ncbi:hypothetical protein ACFQJ7_14010 [Halovenus rubra]|uniref:Uncharacterized protein n=2 Tax=Halovenus rubra TaxID=869890 RepID=A0ACC7DYZ5_9EURY|nr:hypothetical protein [Halovenus rubra]
MVGTTLSEIRAHIEQLASESGDYYIACSRTRERPVPAAGKRFDDRATARSAARATEQYRTALRRYDPQVPYYDLIVCQELESLRTERSDNQGCGGYQTLSEPVLNGSSLDLACPERVEFCHRVAAAVFETLSDFEFETVETAVMDAYFELAESIDNPDDLCLCLLEGIATELDSRLEPAKQGQVLTEAATRVGPTDISHKPLSVTLNALEERGLLGSHTCSPWSLHPNKGARSVVVQLSEYELTPQRGRLPVLPIAIELYRRRPSHPPASIRVVEQNNSWQATFVFAETAEPNGLATAPITANQ